MKSTKTSEARNQTRKTTTDYYLVHDSGDGKLLGRMINLSEGGFKIICDENLTVGKVVACRIKFPKVLGNSNELIAEATVRWSQRNARLGWYESGFEFSEMPAAALDILRLALADFLY